MTRVLIALLALIGLLAVAEAGGFRRGGGIAPPIITLVTPPGGSTAGGGTVTLTGSWFNGATQVRLDAVPLAAFTVVSNSQITFTAPAKTAGTYNIFVVTPIGVNAKSPQSTYVYTAPPVATITNVSPNSGPTTGGTPVTVTGTNFVNGGTTLNFGATPGTSPSCTTTVCTVTSPSGSGGTVDITAVTASGTSTTSPLDQFTYTTPTPFVTSVVPNRGGTLGGVNCTFTPACSLTVNGSGFTGATSIAFGATTVPVCPTAAPVCFSFVDDSTITAVWPAGTGTKDVTVTTPAGTSPTGASDQFTYQDWATSFTSGGNDVFGNLMSGIETRVLYTHWVLAGGVVAGTNLLTTCGPGAPGYSAAMNACAVVFAGLALNSDATCVPGYGPSVIALNSPTGAWVREQQLDGGCRGDTFAGNDLTFTVDGSGAAISPPLTLAMQTGQGPFIWTRNDATGLFVQNAAGTGLEVSNANRSFTNHLDTTTTHCGGGPCNLAIVGNDTNGPFTGTFLASPFGFTFGSVGESFGASPICHVPQTCTNKPSAWATATIPPATGPYAVPTTATSNDATPSRITVTWTGAWQTPPQGKITITGFSTNGGSGDTNADVTSATITSATKTSATFTATGQVICKTLITGGSTGCSGGTIGVGQFTQSGCPGTYGACNTIFRMMAMTDCPLTGGGTAAFASVGLEIRERVDGNSPYWKFFWVVPPPGAAQGSNSGLRGLTCVPYGSKYVLLAAQEGGSGCIFRIDPNGVDPDVCETTVHNLQWMRSYGIEAYNKFIPCGNASICFGEGTSVTPPTTHPYYVGSDSSKHDDVSGVYVRGASGAYRLFPTDNGNGTGPYKSLLGVITPKVPQTNVAGGVGLTNFGALCTGSSPPLCPMMNASRGVVVSLFSQDGGDVPVPGFPQQSTGGQFFYFCGPDDAVNQLQDTAWCATVPFSTVGGIQ